MSRSPPTVRWHCLERPNRDRGVNWYPDSSRCQTACCRSTRVLLAIEVDGQDLTDECLPVRGDAAGRVGICTCAIPRLFAARDCPEVMPH